MNVEVAGMSLNMHRRGRQMGPLAGCIIFPLMSGVMILIGLLALGFIAPQVRSNHAVLTESFVESVAKLESVEIGDDVSFTGVLVDNQSLDAQGGAVAYIEEVLTKRERRYRSNGEYKTKTEWRWSVQERNFPPLSVALGGGHTLITADGIFSNLRGNYHETLAPIEGGLFGTHPYHGQRLEEGSIRVRSLVNGDTITVVGRKLSGGTIAIRELFVGTQDGLASELTRGNWVLQGVGYLFTLVGALLLVFGGGRALRRVIGR
ncbi:MAG: hypothetical protein AAF702_34390 [Chloroflexota bacterium]